MQTFVKVIGSQYMYYEVNNMNKIMFEFAGIIDSHACRNMLRISLLDGYGRSLNFEHVLLHYTAEFHYRFLKWYEVTLTPSRSELPHLHMNKTSNIQHDWYSGLKHFIWRTKDVHNFSYLIGAVFKKLSIKNFLAIF